MANRKTDADKTAETAAAQDAAPAEEPRAEEPRAAEPALTIVADADAEAAPLNETVRGGRYLVRGALVDANGKPLEG